jgi:O-antigen/teichoic acid export membrane protein
VTATAARLGRNLALLLAVDLMGRTATALAFVVVSRELGPAVFGVLSVGLAVMSYAMLVAELGLTVPAQRQLVTDHDLAPVRRAVALKLIASGAVAAGGAFWVLGHRQEQSSMVLAALAPFLVLQALDVAFVLQARERAAQLATSRGVGQLVGAAVTILLALTTHEAVWVAVGVWSAALMSDLLALRAVGFGGLRPVKGTLRDASSALREGVPYLANGVLTNVLISADVLVLGVLRSPRETGLYAGAYRIPALLFSFSTLVVMVVFPELVRRTGSSDRAAAERFVRALVRVVLRLSVPVSVVIGVFAPTVSEALLGGRYGQADEPLRILAGFVPLAYVNTVLAQSLVAAGRQAVYTRANVAAAACALAILAGTVPWAGMRGAAWSVTATEGLLLVVLVRSVLRELDLRMLPALAGEALAALLSIGLALAVQAALPGWAGLLTALAVLLGVNAWRCRNDFAPLRTLLSRRRQTGDSSTTGPEEG